MAWPPKLEIARGRGPLRPPGGQVHPHHSGWPPATRPCQRVALTLARRHAGQQEPANQQQKAIGRAAGWRARWSVPCRRRSEPIRRRSPSAVPVRLDGAASSRGGPPSCRPDKTPSIPTVLAMYRRLDDGTTERPASSFGHRHGVAAGCRTAVRSRHFRVDRARRSPRHLHTDRRLGARCVPRRDRARLYHCWVSRGVHARAFGRADR